MTVFFVILGVFLFGTALGFFVSKKIMFKYLKENNPLNEQMIGMMLMHAGQKPSQKKVSQIMKALDKEKGKK